MVLLAPQGIFATLIWLLDLTERELEVSAALQNALKDDSATQVCCNFFGDGTANNGKKIRPARQNTPPSQGSCGLALGSLLFCQKRHDVKPQAPTSNNVYQTKVSCAGQFYECLNMAALYNLPCVFVVENNKWAIGMNHPRATGPSLGDNEPYIYKKGPAFGMPGVLVDGMDVRKVLILQASNPAQPPPGLHIRSLGDNRPRLCTRSI